MSSTPPPEIPCFLACEHLIAEPTSVGMRCTPVRVLRDLLAVPRSARLTSLAYYVEISNARGDVQHEVRLVSAANPDAEPLMVIHGGAFSAGFDQPLAVTCGGGEQTCALELLPGRYLVQLWVNGEERVTRTLDVHKPPERWSSHEQGRSRP